MRGFSAVMRLVSRVGFFSARTLACLCLLSAAIPALGLIGHAVAETGSIVRDIKIEGAQRITPETIRSHLQFATGAPYDAAAVDRSLKALFATGQFSDVRIERRGETVVITVAENPTINSITFKGNSALDAAKLSPVLELKQRAAFTPAKAEAGTRRIRDLYRAQGRFKTTVVAKTTPLAENRVDLVFEIHEGEVIKVQRIGFVGNRAFSESELRDVITTSQSSWLDILKTSVTYDPERLGLDRELLRRHYLNNGFPDAKVSAADAQLDPAETGFLVTFTIEEGDRFTFGEAKVESRLTEIDAAGLQSQLSIRSGDAYKAQSVTKSVEAVTVALADKAKSSARVTPKETRNNAQHTIALTFLIEDGPRLIIERISVSGNTRTKDEVIRRELRLAEGDAYNGVLVERAKKRIERLGFFKSVEIKRERGSQDDQVALGIEVTEQETAELSFGIGYSDNEGIIGDVGYTERNLCGNGQQLRVKFAGSFTRLQADIGFTEPHFLDSNVAAGFDLFYKDIDQTRQSSYKSQKAGGDVRLGFALTDTVSSTVNYTFARNKLYDVGADASAAIKEAVPGYPANNSSTYYTSSVGYTLAYDTRNDKKNATSGIYTSLGQDFAGLGGDVRYIRTVGEARGYYAVTDKVTLMGRATAGNITGWGGEDVRLLDLFYKGGETVRGFATAGFGPRDIFSANKDALGGRYFYATTAELRFPIPLVPDSFALRGAVFADAGSLWGVNTTASGLAGLAGNTAAPRASVGTGLVWDSPVGPLQLSYAVPLFKQPSDKTQPLSFGLGPAF